MVTLFLQTGTLLNDTLQIAETMNYNYILISEIIFYNMELSYIVCIFHPYKCDETYIQTIVV